jgi:hypothetical protein
MGRSRGSADLRDRGPEPGEKARNAVRHKNEKDAPQDAPLVPRVFEGKAPGAPRASPGRVLEQIYLHKPEAPGGWCPLQSLLPGWSFAPGSTVGAA